MAKNNLMDGTASWSECGGQMLHLGTGTFSSGAQFKLGDGTATLLWLSPTGVGVGNVGGFAHELQSAATAARTITFADNSGMLQPIQQIKVVPTSSNTNSTTTLAAVPGCSLPLAANTDYLIEVMLVMTTNAATTGGKVGFSGGSQITASGITWTGMGETAETTVTTSFTSAAGKTTPFVFRGHGYLRTGATVGTDLQLTWASEIAALCTVVAARMILIPLQ